MASLAREAPLRQFVAALRTATPIIFERELPSYPNYAARRVYLLHAAAERFSAHACRELVNYWEKSKEPFASSIAAYWGELCQWLPLDRPVEGSAQAVFNEGYRLEYEVGNYGAAKTAYLCASAEHPLAAASAGRLGTHSQRLHGWMRYKGPCGPAVMSLQCLSIFEFCCHVYRTSEPHDTGCGSHSSRLLQQGVLAARLSVMLGHTEAVLFLASWKILPYTTQLFELLALAARQSLPSLLLLRVSRKQDSLTEAALALIQQDGDTRFVIEDQCLFGELSTMDKLIPSVEELYQDVLPPILDLSWIAISVDPLFVSYTAPALQPAAARFPKLNSGESDALEHTHHLYANIDTSVQPTHFDPHAHPSTVYANAALAVYSSPSAAARSTRAALPPALRPNIAFPLASVLGTDFPPEIASSHREILESFAPNTQPLAASGRLLLVWCTQPHLHPCVWVNITETAAWVCDGHEVYLCNGGKCHTTAGWKRFYAEIWPLSTEHREAELEGLHEGYANIAADTPDIAARRVFAGIFTTYSFSGMRRIITCTDRSEAEQVGIGDVRHSVAVGRSGFPKLVHRALGNPFVP